MSAVIQFCHPLSLPSSPPGTDVVPWLGNLNNLAPVTDFTESPYGEDNNKTPFPVKPPDRHSYAQNCVVWIKPAGLQVNYQIHGILFRILDSFC